MLRRTLATIAATAVAVTGLAPAASAQLGAIDGLIKNADCRIVDPLLKQTFQIDGNTTRSDLSRQIRNAAKENINLLDPSTYLVSARYADQIADKAVACGTVKKDPELFPGSSIPNVGNMQDLLADLSSVLNPR
ncbi:MAG: hypothetical protein Q4G50_00875 [Corynebacterium sp.]|uniref:hypothetical protein n=1 Tax=Corynebacterium sp. TaxID=1720 RepID=UPI0026DFB9B4|nr:hypothetical protein [Corynebacterium sp.]MDO5668535.1 hypothetical protein [Corynebacterium sp.]